MYIAYYDETGDFGFPGSSPLFVLSALYVHYLHWKDVFTRMQAFRKQVKIDFGLPVNVEMHTKAFLINKKPYRDYNISEEARILLIDLFCDLVAQLPVKNINVIINKKKVRDSNYVIFERSFTYSIQRIENDLCRIDPMKRFLIITDEGNIGQMRAIARKIQRFNYIPSRFNPSTYRQEIKLLIEDPLSKDSKESYFIQMADMISYIVYLYGLHHCQAGNPHGRLPALIDRDKIEDWLDRLKNIINLDASPGTPFGIVCYPK
ncbi:MAG: DUF3800 domain-containing protein [Vulcanimicrobiota bacterium]